MSNNVYDFFDFNTARPQGTDVEHTETVQELKDRLLSRIRLVLGYLLPGVRYRAGKGIVGDIMGNVGDSMTIELDGQKAGQWFDHATGQGGDILDLWAAVHGKSCRSNFSDVLDSVHEWLDGRSRRPGAPTIQQVQDYMPPPPAPKEPAMDTLGPRTGEWIYTDANGDEIARVWRYDPVDPDTGEIGKEFRPWDTKRRKMAAPELRPLYNQTGMAVSSSVVIAEGEKCAQALIDAGICATTAMQGAKAPVAKTDWSPVAGKRVTIWPDKDAPGWAYAESVSAACITAGAVSVTILVPPDDKPAKWDAADCIAEGGDPNEFIKSSTRSSTIKAPAAPLNIFEWKADRYKGKAPVQNFLIEGVFPLSVAGILAAMGDTGKGMITLDLALKIATGKPHKVDGTGPRSLGGEIKAFGSAVIFTAEDDIGEVHRRLDRLDPTGARHKHAERLMVIPLPNAGGPTPLVTEGKDGPMETKQFHMIRDQLLTIKDLRLIVFDPLASFIHADVTADPAAGSFATGLMASLATETGAAVILPHHMRKPQGNKPITTAEQARDAIRGTSAIVDGVRASYALWPAPDENQAAVFKALDMKPTRNAVYMGAVVKSNGPADRTVRTFVRNDIGLLVDVTDRLKAVKMPRDEAMNALVDAIAQAARDGNPFCKTGQAGLYGQRHRLPAGLSEKGKRYLQETLPDELLSGRRIVQCSHGSEKAAKWLDVPDGPFALGVGEFAAGAAGMADGA